MDNLVRTYHKALPSDFCEFIIDRFENSGGIVDGITGHGVKKSVKDSKDLMIHDLISINKDWGYIYLYLTENLLGKFVDYLRKNPYVFPNCTYKSEACLIRTASSAFGVYNNGAVHMQMQRYTGDQGYHFWHYENEGGNTGARELFFIYYLNDVTGGSTEFKFNPSAIEPKEGMLLIAPAHWTHMHKGNPPTGEQTKYIITGWLEKRVCGINDEFQEDYYI